MEPRKPRLAAPRCLTKRARLTAPRRPGAPRRATLLAALGFFAAATAAPAKPLFQVPVRAVLAEDTALAALAGDLDTYSQTLQQNHPTTGYDWVFPDLYAKVTGVIRAKANEPGYFRRPDLVRAEIAQFYEIYAANANAWIRGERAERQWRRAARVSRLMGALDFTDAGDRRSAAMVQALFAVYAHICVDLPRALLVVHQNAGESRSLSDLKADYQKVAGLFGPIIERVVQEGEISPRFLKRLWPHLPAWMREVIVGGKTPLGAGVFLRSARRFAWLRFRTLAARRRWRREAAALPKGEALLGLALPAPGSAPVEAEPVRGRTRDMLGDRLAGLETDLPAPVGFIGDFADDGLASIDAAFGRVLREERDLAGGGS